MKIRNDQNNSRPIWQNMNSVNVISGGRFYSEKRRKISQ